MNPTESELGMVSKKMHVQILSDVRSKSHLIQFKNSDSTIPWFKKIENKRRKSFIQFDVCDFYVSINQQAGAELGQAHCLA